MKKFLFIIFLFCSLYGISQTGDIPALIEKSKTQKEDTNKVDILNEIAAKYRENDNVKALEYGGKAFELAQKINYRHGLWTAANNVGEANRFLGKIEDALKWHQKALDIAEKNDFVIQQGNSYNNLALVAKATKNYDKAEQYFMLALKAYQKADRKRGYYTIYNNLANLQVYQGKIREAYGNILKAYKVAVELNDSSCLSQSLNNIGGVLWELEKNDSCTLVYEQAFKIARVNSTKRELVNCGTNLAYMYFYFGPKKKGEDLFKEMLEEARHLGDKSELFSLYGYMAEIYFDEGKYKLAYLFQDSARVINKEILNTENIRSINSLTALYENEKKELQISNLSKENEVQVEKLKRENIFKIVFAVGFLVIGVFAVFLIYSLREKEKARKIIDEQKKVVEEKQSEILDSIKYAKRIQNALLPSDKYFSKYIRPRKK